MPSIATRRTPDHSRRREPRSTFDIYLEATGGYDLLTAEAERAQLCAIVELRRARWHALLGEPTLDTVRAWILSTAADAARPTEAVALLRERWQSSRDTEWQRDAVAVAVDALDLDGALADRLEAVITADPRSTAARDVPALQIGVEHRRARNRFACSNLRLVVRMASRHADGRMSLADRVQEGNLGLLMAVGRFDPERGYRFSTYAAWWIRFAITRALVNRGRSVRIPAHLHAIVGQARRAEQALRAELGREPELDEIAAAIDVPLEKLIDAREAMETRIVALDEPGREDGALGPALVCNGAAERDAAIDERRNLAVTSEVFDVLDPMERDIIEQRFGLRGAEVMTLGMLGKRYDLSRERIRQLQNRALDKLRVAVVSSPVGATLYA
jgi:RNA polymerase primary sigma factor